VIRQFLEGIVNETLGFLKYCDPAKLHQYCDSGTLRDVFRVESSWRSFADQHALYTSGRGVTLVDQGDSYHNWGLAVDIIFTRYGYLSDGSSAQYGSKSYKYAQLADLYEDTGLVAWAKSLGMRWLGRDPQLVDVAHFECYRLPLAQYRLERYAVSGWWDNPDLTSAGSSGVGGVVTYVTTTDVTRPVLFGLAALVGGYYLYKRSKGRAGVRLSQGVKTVLSLVGTWFAWKMLDKLSGGA
jgi:hypothetical protein